MRSLLAAAVLSTGWLAACGDAAQSPPETPDARPSDAPDAPPPPPNDRDRDGHPADADCDDGDATVWQQLPYVFRDADGDHHVVTEIGVVCSGATLPAGYSTVAGPGDCDDANPAVFASLTGFVDTDGDGVGDGAAVSLCTGGALPDGYAAATGDCAPADPAAWVDRSYSFRDVDGDGAAVPETGTVCSGAFLPPTYLASAQPPFDCDDADPAIEVSLTVFADGDGDGFGAGPPQLACTAGAPPPGFSLVGTDCADGDGAVWVSLAYLAVDRDGDTITVPETGTRCTAGVLLPPYFAAGNGLDCDDANAQVSISLAVFADHDDDGFGAGAVQQACTDGTAPDGFSIFGSDCDDADQARWMTLAYTAVDADRDGATVPASGQLCTDGALPPPFEATAHGNDCDDTTPALTHFEVLYPDGDGDTVGAPPREIHCLGTALPAGRSRLGYDEDDDDPLVIEIDPLIDLLLLET